MITKVLKDVHTLTDVLLLYVNVMSVIHADVPLTRESFKQLCTYDRSESGSNRFNAEEDTIYCWECFLLNVEGSSHDHVIN